MRIFTMFQSRQLINLGTQWASGNVHRWILITGGLIKWLGNHLYFSPATIFIQGLVFSNSFVNHGIVGILVTYLEDNWKIQHLQMAAIITNVHEGISNIMVILMAHITDAYFGPFKMVAFTTAAYVLGLLVLYLSAGYMTVETAAKVIYGGLVLVAVGEAGRSASLGKFLHYEYRSQQKQPDCISDENLRSGTEALWRLPWVIGAIIPLLLTTTWTQILMISTIEMGVTFLIFLLGSSWYSKNKNNDPIDPALEEARREKGCDSKVENYKQQPQRGEVWRLIKKLKERGFMKEILAILLAFLVYSLVEATGSTFFFEQLDNLDTLFMKDNAALYLNIVLSFSKFISPVLWSLLIPAQWWRSTNATLAKIGCGMFCSVLCSFAALQVELHRMNQVISGNLEDDNSTTISISVLWLIPQFCLLGMMEGLAVEGVVDLFVDRVGDDTEIARYYGDHITDFVLGIGKLITALIILALKGAWFHDKMNMSRLDEYYRVLIILTSVNFCYYMCIAFRSSAKKNSQQCVGRECKQVQQPIPETKVFGPWRLAGGVGGWIVICAAAELLINL